MVACPYMAFNIDGVIQMIEIHEATKEDAAIITSLMHDAFRRTFPPSSALLETEENIREQLENGQEQAAIAVYEGRASFASP